MQIVCIFILYTYTHIHIYSKENCNISSQYTPSCLWLEISRCFIYYVNVCMQIIYIHTCTNLHIFFSGELQYHTLYNNVSQLLVTCPWLKNHHQNSYSIYYSDSFSYYFIYLFFLRMCHDVLRSRILSPKNVSMPFRPQKIQRGSWKTHIFFWGTGHFCLHMGLFTSSVSEVLML